MIATEAEPLPFVLTLNGVSSSIRFANIKRMRLSRSRRLATII